jgi:NADPH-dependent 2,4-dienoyl-CoA reductase/sulfur reductase-like enzyme
VQAESVDVHRKRIKLSSDVNALHYDYLVLATGGSPRHLQCPGAIDANTGASTPIVYYLRTPDDALAIIRQAVAKHVVIVGTGFIGLCPGEQCARTYTVV